MPAATAIHLDRLEDRHLLAVSFAAAGASAMLYDAAGTLHAAWYDTVDHALKYARRDPIDGWSDPLTIDPASDDVGSELAIALDATGRPGIAYYDATNRDLKYAHKNRRGWTVEAVDRAGTVGHNPSLAYDIAGLPLISYYAASTADLRLAALSSSGWSITTIDATGSVGQFSQITVNPADGNWAIAYESQSDRTVRYAQRVRKSFSTRIIDTLPDTRKWQVTPQLEFDAAGTPTVAYVDRSTGELVVNRPVGKTWRPARPAIDARAADGYTTLSLDPATGTPRVTFTNPDGVLTLAAATPSGDWLSDTIGFGNGLDVAAVPDPFSGRITLVTPGSETFVFDPSAPPALALTANATTDGVALNWNIPDGAMTLLIERKATDDVDFTQLGLISVDYAGFFVDSDPLTPGVSYLYRAKVYVGTARSAFWSTSAVSF